MILRNDEFSLDFATKDDFKTYRDEYERYLKPLMEADDNTLRNLYCKYNKNVENQRTLFGRDYFKTEKKQDSAHTDQTEAEFSQKTEDCAAYFDRGFAHINNGNYGQAIEDFSRAIELHPKYAGALIGRGIACVNLANYNQAIQDYDRAIELSPTFAMAYNNRGTAYDKIGNNKQAIEDYNKAIELNPKYAGAYFSRGGSYAKLGNYNQAINDVKMAARLGLKEAQDYLRKQKISW